MILVPVKWVTEVVELFLPTCEVKLCAGDADEMDKHRVAQRQRRPTSFKLRMTTSMSLSSRYVTIAVPDFVDTRAESTVSTMPFR
jgi:hypothetical protein